MICNKILAHETTIMSLSTHDSAHLVIELRKTITAMFHLYQGKVFEPCRSAPTTTTPFSTPIDYAESTRAADMLFTDWDTNKLINLVQRKLLELVAIGPPRETLRILSSRLLEVIKTKEAYKGMEVCAEDERRSLEKMFAEIDKVQALLKYEL